jgi:hypothetical protein
VKDIAHPRFTTLVFVCLGNNHLSSVAALARLNAPQLE